MKNTDEIIVGWKVKRKTYCITRLDGGLAVTLNKKVLKRFDSIVDAIDFLQDIFDEMIP